MRAWLLIIGLVLSFGAHATLQLESTPKVQKQIKTLEAALARIEKNILKQQSNLSKTEKNLQHTDLEIATMSQDILKTKQSIVTLKLNIHQYNVELQALAQEQEGLLKRLQIYVKGLHAHQQDNPLKWLLQLDKLSDIQKLGIWYEYFANSQAQLLKSLRDTTKQTQHAQAQLSNQQTQLQDLTQTLQRQHLNLKEKRKEQIKFIARLNSNLKKNIVEKGTLSRQHEQLTQLLAELNKASKLEYIDVGNDFASMLGRLPMPISQRKIKRQALEQSYLEAKEGTEVHAIHPGRVVFSEWLRGLGLLLIIDHGRGYMSLYGNNQVLFKSTGDWVNLGDQISLVGKSGGLSKPGLYFEIRKDGTPLDTNRWVRNG